MKLLTRPEEFILLAIWQLQENAYCVPIRSKISEISGEEWSLGSIYMPLDRLVKKGYLDSYLSEATPERGGKSKRYYSLTEDGLSQLQEIQKVYAAFWNDMPDLSTGAI